MTTDVEWSLRHRHIAYTIQVLDHVDAELTHVNHLILIQWLKMKIYSTVQNHLANYRWTICKPSTRLIDTLHTFCVAYGVANNIEIIIILEFREKTEMHQPPTSIAGSNTGSLPDLTSIHFPLPQHQYVDNAACMQYNQVGIGINWNFCIFRSFSLNYFKIYCYIFR
jgi:hypothetical protein